MKKIRIGGVPEHFNLPWHLAIENNFFSKEGVDLEWKTCKGGTGQMCSLLEEGELDMAVLLTEGAIKRIIDQKQFKILQVYIKTPLVWGLHTGIDSKIEKYADAFNSTIAISRFGSGSHLMPQVDAHFKKSSISTDKWKVIKNLEGAIEQFKKQPDMVFYWEKFTTKPLVDSGDLKRIGEFITPWPCFVIVANNKVVKNSKAEVKSILKVINYTSQQLMDATNAIEMFQERYEMLPDDAHQWFHMTEWAAETDISDKLLNSVMQTLQDCGIIEQQVNPQELKHIL